MVASTPLATLALMLWVRTGATDVGVISGQHSSSLDGAGTGNDFQSDHHEKRSKQTSADLYYRENKKIPFPPVIHASLTELVQNQANSNGNRRAQEVDVKSKKNMLVIGDVHGCYDDLLALHEKAVMENDSIPFEHVFLVGDLCNKGPDSAKVIRHVRLAQDWYSVRGNHDDGALAAALGDKSRVKKKKYRWIKDDEKLDSTDGAVSLSDDDIMWLAELPYTIRIPGSALGEAEDTIIVHAGFIPNTDLEDQEIETMTTMRDLLPICDGKGHFQSFKGLEKAKGGEAKVAESEVDAKECNVPTTWASAWRGPHRVVFGHNAKRRLQLYPGNWAIGLDTGAVYGGQLTGIILPERRLVSIDTKDYSQDED
jgi:bis(5'-nucleosyl)-tetraphosphatase (symmetrical)